MSWKLFVVPVDGLSRDGMAEWIASADFTRGVPEQTPPLLPRPSIAEVLAAFRAAGCHGTNLTAACALAAVSGPQLVFDESATSAFVVRPGEEPESLEQDRPW